jgi:hypothetical protein
MKIVKKEGFEDDVTIPLSKLKSLFSAWIQIRIRID